MASAVRNCVRLLSVPLTTALRFASTHPAEFLGLGNRLGKLATGYRAAMVALDGAAIAVLDTWVAGAGGERFPEIDPLLSPIRPNVHKWSGRHRQRSAERTSRRGNNVASASTWPHARNLLQILTNKICHDICSNVDAISECSLAVFSSN